MVCVCVCVCLSGCASIRRQLLRGDPATVVSALHASHSVRSVASLPAVYALLSALGVSRSAGNRRVVSSLLARLLQRVASVEPPSALLALLDDSFAYLALDELRVVPIACMQRLQTVPRRVLRRLAEQPTLLQVSQPASQLASQPARQTDRQTADSTHDTPTARQADKQRTLFA